MKILEKIKANNEYACRGTDPYDVEFLNKAINMYPACKYLEIGTAYGGSLFSVIDSLLSIGGVATSVDFYGPLLMSGDPGPDKDEKIKRHTHTQNLVNKHQLTNVQLHTEGSNIFFEKLAPDEKFHVIFIDGDHSYIQSKKDLENSIKHLHEDGIILLDDIKIGTQGLPERDCSFRTYKELSSHRKQLYHDLGFIYGPKNNTKYIGPDRTWS